MLLPGLIVLILNNYLPMFGIIVAFKNVNYKDGILFSPWNGFDNFRLLFLTPDAFNMTRNTILYNLAFIVISLVFSVFCAISLNELRSNKLAKFYQSTMFLPYFLSWVIISYLVYALFSAEFGFVNKMILAPMGKEGILWYSEPQYWPFILIAFNTWKWTGYDSVIYLAAIVGFDTEYYEAAAIDGASKWKQIKHITLPLLAPLMVILMILAVGRIFRADFGLFFQVPRNTGALYDTTRVIDTYVYNALMNTGDLGQSAAAGLYQSVVGFVLILCANFAARKIDPEKALF